MNAKDELLEISKEVGEEILAISIGRRGWEAEVKTPLYFEGKKEVQKALQILDFKFDSGYGGEDGYCLFAWTKNWVIIKGTYDGSEWYSHVPRNPDAKTVPFSIGGG